MLRYLLTSIVLACSQYVYAASEILDNIESKVYETAGSQKELAQRGKVCMAQHLHNDQVQTEDSSGGTIFSPSDGSHRQQIAGGDVFVDVDLDGGVVVANSRVDFYRVMLEHNVKSTVTLMTKDGRFKIKHTGIAYLQKSSGTIVNSGYGPIYKQWGTGWADVQKLLEGLSDKVAHCIVESANSNNNW